MMTPSLTPQAFVAKWQQSTLRERASSQEHFLDLCRLLGHPTPAEADPAGRWFTFEAGAQRLPSPAAAGAGSGVRAGWADVWKMGHFAWEYKGGHANLDRAYAQLLQYRESLLNPPLLIVSDMARIVIHTNFTNTAKQVHELALEDLLIPARLELLAAAFTNPDALRPNQTPQQVTEEAARQFARLAQLLQRYGNDPHAAAHFLIRLLFCLFAEDVNILPKGLFTRLVTEPGRTSQVLAGQLRQLFAAMAAGGTFGAEVIPHVDGGLFDDGAALALDSDSQRILAELSRLDWSAIKPSILGTLFERSLDPGKRSQLGAHYTGEEDILLIVEPVLMAPLRRRWDAVKVEVKVKAEKRDLIAGSKPSPQRTRQLAKVEAELFARLRGFRGELAAVQVLDAACGSGNFLYVALRLLLDLEKEAINLAAGLGDSLSFPMVSPAQLHGIEINPYAYELAQTTIWIGYIQWWRDNGFGLPEEPILKPLQAIRLMDAVLTVDSGQGTVDSSQWAGVREPEWPAADVIIGNPPFLGSSRIRSELGDSYVESLARVYGDRLPACDLVCYWFEKARAQIEAGRAKRAGLLATQGIRGGANRRVLERIKESGDIFWAQSDRNWVLDGATVHVSMVGFDNGSVTSRLLDNRSVPNINPDLTAMIDLTKAQRLHENLGISFKGAEPGGPFDIAAEVAQSMLAAPLNPNSRPNSDVVRPVLNAADLMQVSRNMYTIDFGLMSLEEAAQYELPFEHVKRVVYPVRASNKESIRAEFWWRYARPRPEMRRALEGKSRYVVTPGVSKHRVFVWQDQHVLCNNLLCIIARSDDYFIGVLQSRTHEVWSRRLGTQLREAESGQRYTNTTSFETFPFPWPPGQEPAGDLRVEAVAAAARELVALRDAWLNPHPTPRPSAAPLPSPERGAARERGEGRERGEARTLTNLYNARPTWLDLAHRRLDAAVLDAYGWPRDVSDDEILARLLALNLARAETR